MLRRPRAVALSDRQRSQIGIGESDEVPIIHPVELYTCAFQVVSRLYEAALSEHGKAVNQQGLSGFVRHSELVEAGPCAGGIFTRVVEGVESEKYLGYFLIAPRYELIAAHLREMIARLVVACERSLVVAVQELNICNVKAGLFRKERLAGGVVYFFGSGQQRQGFFRTIELEQNVGAIQIDKGPHCGIGPLRQHRSRPVVVIERVFIAIQTVIDVSDIGFELRV